MAKFNVKKEELNKTVNKSGFVAFKMEDKEKLATMVFTTMFGEVKFYGDNTSEIVDLAERLIEQDSGQFVAKLGSFCKKRNELAKRFSRSLCYPCT